MNHASTNGFLTREQSDQLCYSSIDITGFGKVHFRKLGRDEWETFWPLVPPAADEWPVIVPLPDDPTEEQRAAHSASAAARRKAEFEWLRREPDEVQVRYQGRRNDVVFRTIVACATQPTYAMEGARALGDWGAVLYLAIMTFSGLYKEPSQAPPAVSEAAEATADAG